MKEITVSDRFLVQPPKGGSSLVFDTMIARRKCARAEKRKQREKETVSE